MQRPDAIEVLPQWLQQASRQQRDSILHALAITDDDLVASEIHILDPQTHRLHQAHAGAVQQSGNQSDLAVETRQQPLGFFAGQDDGQTLRALRTHHFTQPGQIDGQDMLVEEQQGGQRLILRGRRNIQIDRKVR
ncbi:hypothetical protein D3C75_822610 [compost metagenome]